jgi:hypothetical protein
MRKLRWWAIAIRCAAVPFWYPFAVLGWIGEKSDVIFWWIESKVLLENQIAVGTISMKHDPESAEGVLLLVQWENEEQEAAANAVGFRTKRTVGGVVIDE